MSESTAMTVLGPVPTSELGTTLMHVLGVAMSPAIIQRLCIKKLMLLCSSNSSKIRLDV